MHNDDMIFIHVSIFAHYLLAVLFICIMSTYRNYYYCFAVCDLWSYGCVEAAMAM